MKTVKRPDFANYFEEPLEAFKKARKFLDDIGKNHIDDSAKILEYSVIEPPCYIGKNTTIGPFVHILPYSFIGDECAVWTFSVVNASIILEGTHIPHLNYVGYSIIGKNCNLGAGTKTANLRFDEKDVKINYHGKRIGSGRKRLGTITGDNVKTGINVSILPGVKIGSGCRIGPAVLVDRDLGENVFYGYRNGILKKERLI
ncbi:MAG: hypothetical protein WA139_00700 [Candidatus Aenigmatarchaeota archaeon]